MTATRSPQQMHIVDCAHAAHQSVEEVATRYGAHLTAGLHPSDAAQRAQQHGRYTAIRFSIKALRTCVDVCARNILLAKQKETLWDKLLEQVKNPLIALLLFSALLSFLMGQWDDAVSIGLVLSDHFVLHQR